MSDTIQKPELPKRFYKEVAVEETEAGFEIRLDGRGVRTPARALLAVRKREAAEAIAAEWQAQGTHIDPATMTVTRLVNTVLDGVSQNLDLTRQDLGRYAETDLLAYRADGPDRLVARQREIWDPVLRWAEERFGIKVAVASGVMHVAQSPQMLDALRASLRSEADPFRLAAIHQITTLTGSLLLAMAVSEGHLGEAEAWHAAHVDEDWNIELWGDDEEAKARRTSRFEDMRAAALLLRS